MNAGCSNTEEKILEAEKLLEGFLTEIANAKVITASLEGERVVVLPACALAHLEEYNFETHQYSITRRSPWPMSFHESRSWVSHWNKVDRTAAVVALRGGDLS